MGDCGYEGMMRKWSPQADRLDNIVRLNIPLFSTALESLLEEMPISKLLHIWAISHTNAPLLLLLET